MIAESPWLAQSEACVCWCMSEKPLIVTDRHAVLSSVVHLRSQRQSPVQRAVATGLQLPIMRAAFELVAHEGQAKTSEDIVVELAASETKRDIPSTNDWELNQASAEDTS